MPEIILQIPLPEILVLTKLTVILRLQFSTQLSAVRDVSTLPAAVDVACTAVRRP